MRIGHGIRQLADFVADAVIATDAAYQITYWNEAATRLLGWTAREARGRHSLQLLQVTFLDSSLDDAIQSIEQTGRWTGRVTQVSKAGQTRVSEAMVATLPDSAGGAPGYVIAIHDLRRTQGLIDARIQAETALATALAFITSILEAAPVGIMTYRLSGECISANAEAARMVGGAVAELQRQNFRSLASWQRSGLVALADAAIEAPQSSDVAILTSFGRQLWVLARLGVFRADGEDHLLVVFSDITARKQAEEEQREHERVLRQSQAELRKLSRAIEQSPASVLITDRRGVIEYVNPSALALSGYRLDEVLGQTPRLFKSGETSAEEYGELWETITRGETWRGELHNRSKSGLLYWERATVSPVFDDSGTITHFVAIKEHVDAQKSAESAASDAERRFLRAQRMEAVGQLAGGIAHDFNNLLTAILGYTDFALDAAATEPGLRADLEEIRKAAERATRLTRQLLAFSRKQRLEPANVDLNQVIGDLVKMVERVIGEDITIDVRLDPDLGLARLDPGQVEQVIMNLVVNARDAMPSGGRLAIVTTHAALDDAFAAQYPGAVPGPHVTLKVSDTGSGMPPEILARMFDPFFTTKPVGRGTGLGLATVLAIVKQSGGQVDVESEVGAGTTFTLYFPRLPTDAIRTSTAAAGAAPQGGHDTILVVDDDAALRDVMERGLSKFGYHVVTAAGGIAAIQLEQEHHARIDLLVSDVVMPVMGGLELAVHLARRRPGMKTLFISGFASDMPGGFDQTTAAFLSKPFTIDSLARKVRRVLDGAETPPAAAG